MKKLIGRLLVFFVGIPVVLALVFVSAHHHFLLHCAIILFSLAGSFEMYHLLAKKSPQQPLIAVLILTALLPFTALWAAVWGRSWEFVAVTLFVDFLTLAFLEVFCYKKKPAKGEQGVPGAVALPNQFAESSQKLTASFFTVFYAGFLITFLSKLTTLPHSKTYITVFFLMVFLCDSAAWFFGVLFGKNNRGLCRVSPNKSIAGFIGGVIGSGVSAVLGKCLWPDVFPGSSLKLIPLTAFVAFAAILGDLAESLIKRSVEEKDSGNLMPGRGGILDSLDSILVAAPIYYFSLKF
jgi:phosphatidate cytidylyltransferase